ncbi:hypothetical protein BUE93_22160 [Chromobacterium amazonense]|uniref:ATPase n=1 Tax=Chromobacterium amazonense TaxID=1382803 RepID=A0A2S9WYG2_9NEIS|nr:VirB3 family type IV secretion system protein [Chromobacterium amazonense]PRP68507.1 hypothetical protein BUE93_22160 [Chromobacterium amazonense]
METLFKSLTRPAMFMGVPIKPFVAVTMTMFILGAWVSFAVWLFIPLVVFVMGLFAKRDDHVFGLQWLRLRTRSKATKSTKQIWGMDTISPQQYGNVRVPDDRGGMVRLDQTNSLDRIIPYSSHVHPRIVKTKDSQFIAGWEVGGVPFECMDDFDISQVKERIAALYNSRPGVTVYWQNASSVFYDELTGNFGNPFSEMINRKYMEGLQKKKFLKNTLYLTIVFSPVSRIERAANRSQPLEKKRLILEANIRAMEEIIRDVEGALRDCHAQPLGIEEEEGVSYSSLLSLFQFLLTGNWQRIRVSNTPIYQTIGTSLIHLGANTGQMTDSSGKQTFFRCIEIKDYDSHTITGMLDQVLYADIRYVWTQSFTVMNKHDSLSYIKARERQLRSTEDDAISQLEALEEAKDQVAAGKLKMGEHHFSLFIYSDSFEGIEADTSRLKERLDEAGFTTTLSDMALKAAFCSQLPGVLHLRPRLAGISHRNFADMATLHNFFIGKRSRNPWGDAVCLLKTPSQHAAYLNLHESSPRKNEIGNKTAATTGIFGSVGVGKTVVMMFLNNQIQKYGNPLTFTPTAKNKRLTTVFLDYDHGGEIGIRAMGGVYLSVKTGEPTGFQPFFMVSTRRNIAFLKDLIRILCTRNGEKLTPRENEQISKAVEAVMSWPQAERAYAITRVYEHLTADGDTRSERMNSLRVRLKPWTHGNEFGWAFDNASDRLDLSGGDIYGIDGTDFLDDKDTGTPLSAYIIYRVTALMDGRRLVIFMDEFWRWIKDEAFRDFVYKKLKTMRKLNAFIVPATQQPEEILKNELSRAFIEQCANIIGLPNPKASQAEYVDGLKFTQKEFEIISGLSKDSRQFMIKSNSQKTSTLAMLDLSGLGKLTKVLSTDADNLEIFHGIYKEGMPLDQWLPKYLEQAV